ncbi:SPOR domain-containing protein [Ancylomarina sp. 16SWW S1-10-2]|uniref:SPOR domain-containing protein n=1 Tax=Ancylomarina sp. 16SWW S1-10-2 TaxID=2499681 RepID=UPI0012AE9F18|nr:SPOR domain-containing protein [Ancylomarina sp. 16SWW S1-10-2]MRT93886.1 SPOR domain-containing protein [Ancylomarina sp. 16SWW S1-10-2]
MKSYKYSLISLLIILSACSNKELTKIDGTNVVELTANREIPKAPSAESQQLSKTFSLTQILENRALFNYHIVGGSSKRKNTALTLSQQLYKKGYPCRIIETNGRYRVIIQSFASKEVAVQELKRLKKLNHKPDLWILKE